VVQPLPECVFVPLVAGEELLACAGWNAGGQGDGLDALLALQRYFGSGLSGR
jgi:hypothetical protein